MNNNSYDIEKGIDNLSINLSSPSLKDSTIPHRSTVNYSDSDPESEEHLNDADVDDDADDEGDVQPENIKIHMGTRVMLDDTITRTRLKYISSKMSGLSNNIEIDKRSDAGSAHLDEIDFKTNDKERQIYVCDNNPIKLKYLFYRGDGLKRSHYIVD